MKLNKLLILFLITLGLFWGYSAKAQDQNSAPDLNSSADSSSEKIDSFDEKIQINADATFNVVETIKYNFGDTEHHGIYRDIPIKYNRDNNKFNLRISDISVKDENGTDYNYDISYPGDDIEIKIGDADVLVTGVKTYVISYKIIRAINYFSDHDELYWNVTGNGWSVPIDASSAVITLPQAADIGKLQIACFSGAEGSTDNCSSKDFVYNSADKTQVNGAEFKQGALNANEGLTIVFGWPKGIVAVPTWQENFKYFVEDNRGMFLFILVALACLVFWWFKGKDPKGRGTIIAEYAPPAGLSPAEVGTIYDEKTGEKEVSAEIINLAVKGYLKIKREMGGTIIKKPEYTLIKLKEPGDLSVGHEKKLMEALFDAGVKEVKLQDLHDDFYQDYNQITDDIYKLATADGYFPKNPSQMRNGFLGAGLVIAFLLYLLTGSFDTTAGIVSGIIAAIIIIIASRFMSQRTEKGVLAKEQILGLKLYLSVAEKDRINFADAPAQNPERFEKLLPYAMVLGVETQWAAQFAEIYKQPPSWYSTDENLSAFNSMMFVSSLHNFSSQANSSLYTAPASSASSGGSGFGGGGFSGGGFGGGGGGSW